MRRARSIRWRTGVRSPMSTVEVRWLGQWAGVENSAMKTLYLDIFSGISGDMFIGAMIDLGVDPAALEMELKKLRLDGYHLHSYRGQKAQISGIKFDVHLTHDHEHGHHDEHHQHEHTHADGTKH